MLRLIFTLMMLTAFLADSYAQSLPKLSMKTIEKNDLQNAESFDAVLLALFPLNPILMIEGNKFYAGITKEVSFGKYPYGRLAAEYSLIFRETRLNHLRFSYNYDIAIEARDFGAFLFSFGGGYFTDFHKEGIFPQALIGILFALTDGIGTNPYVKIRHTFMTDSGESDITDLSFGLGLYIGL